MVIHSIFFPITKFLVKGTKTVQIPQLRTMNSQTFFVHIRFNSMSVLRAIFPPQHCNCQAQNVYLWVSISIILRHSSLNSSKILFRKLVRFKMSTISRDSKYLGMEETNSFGDREFFVVGTLRKLLWSKMKQEIQINCP